MFQFSSVNACIFAHLFPGILINTLYNVCSVHQGMFSTSGGCSVHRGDTMSTLGDTMSTSGRYHEYIGGCSVHRVDIMMHVGDIMSTLGDVQYIGVFNRN